MSSSYNSIRIVVKRNRLTLFKYYKIFSIQFKQFFSFFFYAKIKLIKII